MLQTRNNLPVEEPTKYYKLNATLIEGRTLSLEIDVKSLFQGCNDIDLSQHDVIELEVTEIMDNGNIIVDAVLFPKLEYAD